MAAVATRGSARGALVEEPRTDGARLFEPQGRTLEDVILGAWEDLAASGRAECPVCRGRLRAAGGCDGCGSDLS